MCQQHGAKNLAIQMKTHGLNALRIASVLTSYPAVEHIAYPGLASHHRTYLHQLTHKQFLSILLPSDLAYGIP
ncbi:hypothetical protein CY34DRAFT_814028, partial [Suillus luteus UH-Slu-Lm8-n1]